MFSFENDFGRKTFRLKRNSFENCFNQHIFWPKSFSIENVFVRNIFRLDNLSAEKVFGRTCFWPKTFSSENFPSGSESNALPSSLDNIFSEPALLLRQVTHKAVFSALEDAGVEPHLIEAVRRLYMMQTAHVQLNGGTKSREVKILRGVRQGDPLSPALFSNVIRVVMNKLRGKWEREKLGITVGSDIFQRERLTHMMFADDTTLLAKSKQALQKMIRDIKRELGTIGLSLNADKCKVQCNVHRPRGATMLKVDDIELPIVSGSDGFKVLGTKFALIQGTGVEFEAPRPALPHLAPAGPALPPCLAPVPCAFDRKTFPPQKLLVKNFLVELFFCRKKSRPIFDGE